jgi:hypothetical protein
MLNAQDWGGGNIFDEHKKITLILKDIQSWVFTLPYVWCARVSMGDFHGFLTLHLLILFKGQKNVQNP